MAYTTRPASFGSVSSGTMRNEDLIPAFASELRYQLGCQVSRFPRRAFRAAIREANTLTNFDSEQADSLVAELSDLLGEFAPTYGYFGSSEGNGSDYGYWLSSYIQQDFDGPQVDDLGEVARGYRGEVLQVSDHGNLTLYVVGARGRVREVWSQV